MTELVQPSFFIDANEMVGINIPTVEEELEKKRRKTNTKVQYDCSTCGLCNKCNSPDMEPYGKGKKGILLIALCPGEEEDEQGIPFVGPSGQYVEGTLEEFGIDMDRDCVRTNIVRCLPPFKKGRFGNKEVNLSSTHIQSCYSKLVKVIEDMKPKLIIAFGKDAINTVLRTRTLSAFTAHQAHGKVFPSRLRGCWVGCCFHPSYILRSIGSRKNKNDELEDLGASYEYLFQRDIGRALGKLGKKLPKAFSEKLGKGSGNFLIRDASKVIRKIRSLWDFEDCHSSPPIAYDYETTELRHYLPTSRILTVSIAESPDKAYCLPLGMNNWSLVERSFVDDEWARFLKSKRDKVVQNYNMEVLWGRQIFGVWTKHVIHDTMFGHHVIDGVGGVNSLGFQTYELVGHEYKDMVQTSRLENTPVKKVAPYNCLDSRYTYVCYEYQLEQLKKLKLEKFYSVLHSVLPTLARMTYRGLLLDTDKMKQMRDDMIKKMEARENQVRNLKSVKGKRFGKGELFTMSNTHHHEELLFDVLKASVVQETSGGRRCVDKHVLAAIGRSKKKKDKEARGFVKLLMKYKIEDSFRKVLGNYLKKADEKDRVHSLYNLHVATSYRSSSNDPSTHNAPKRDDVLKEFRRSIIAPPSYLFGEVDYSGCELATMAMMSGDKNLKLELEKKINLHAKWAGKLFEVDMHTLLKKDSKEWGLVRFKAKNGFVFASIYGAVHYTIANGLDLDPDHVKAVQDEFWETYQGVRVWQEKQVKFYNRHGYVRSVGGFIIPGPLSYNQLFNEVNQGTAAHLLLDGLRRSDEWSRKKKMKSRVNVQVHDSILSEIYKKEKKEFIGGVSKILLSERFDWQQGVPLGIEWCLGKNWLEMNKYDHNALLRRD